MRRTRGARIIRGTVGDGPEDVREDITGRVDIVYVVSGAGMITGKDVLELKWTEVFTRPSYAPLVGGLLQVQANHTTMTSIHAYVQWVLS